MPAPSVNPQPCPSRKPTYTHTGTHIIYISLIVSLLLSSTCMDGWKNKRWKTRRGVKEKRTQLQETVDLRGGWLSQGHLVLQHHQCGCLHKLIPCTLIYKDYKLPLVCSGARSLCIQTAIQPCLLVVQNGTASLWFYLKTLTHIQTHIQYNYFSAAGFYLSFQAEKKKKKNHHIDCTSYAEEFSSFENSTRFLFGD